MSTFSERYDYVAPQNAIIKECMPKEVMNAICTNLDAINDDYENREYGYIHYKTLEMDAWCVFFNQRRHDFRDTGSIITSYFLDDKNPWFQKCDLIEFILERIFFKARKNSPRAINYCRRFVKSLNYDFERLHYGYRIVNLKVTPITSKVEFETIEKAIEESKDNIVEHLSNAVSLFANRENPDYRNSIKESISSVEALCRRLTGESTLGKALNVMEKRGVKIQAQLKDAFEKLYAYTNQTSTGIRHSLMDETTDYRPSFNEAYFMLVACSTFINYINCIIEK